MAKRPAHRGKLVGQEGLHGVDEAVAVGLGQEDQGVDVPPGGVLQGGVGFALIDEPGVGCLGVPQKIPQPVAQALAALLAQSVEQVGVVVQGHIAPVEAQPGQKTGHAGHHTGFHQFPMDGNAVDRSS